MLPDIATIVVGTSVLLFLTERSPRFEETSGKLLNSEHFENAERFQVDTGWQRPVL